MGVFHYVYSILKYEIIILWLRFYEIIITGVKAQAETYLMGTIVRAFVFKKSAFTFNYVNSLGSVCGHLRLISKYVT